MSEDKKEITGSLDENAVDLELKTLLRSWQTPQTPPSLISRLNASYRLQMSRTPNPAGKSFRWTLGVAVAAAAGTLLWVTADRLNIPSVNSKISKPPAVAPDPGSEPAPKRALGRQGGQTMPDYFPITQQTLQDSTSEAGYVLTGKVKSEEGKPLPGAIVSIHEARPDYVSFPSLEWPPAIATQSCDSEGRYFLKVDSPMRAFVTIRKQGFAMNEDEVDLISPGSTIKNHRLRPAPACIEGFVFNKEGVPVAGALVAAPLAAGYAANIPTLTSKISAPHVKSDDSGRYVIRGVPEGNVTVMSGLPAHLIDHQRTQTASGDCGRVDFHLQKALQLSFLVKNKRGEVLPRPSGSCKGQDPETMPFYVEQGILHLGIAPRPGPFECTIGAEGYKSRSVTLDAPTLPYEVILEDLELREIKGRVVTEWDEPLPATRVALNQWTVDTDRDGRFTKALRLPSSRVDIRVHRTGYLEYHEIVNLTDQPAENELQIRLKQSEGGFYGRVVDHAGKPVERFEMIFTRPDRTSYIRGMEDEEGRFSITDIPAAIYDVRVRILPFGPLQFNPIQDLQLKDLELRKGYLYGELLIQFPPPPTRK